MTDKPRLGSDPLKEALDWIKDTRKAEGKQSKQGLQGKQGIEGKQVKLRAGRKRTNFREVTKTSQLGTQEGWTRATFIMREEALNKLKALAFWERKSIKDVMDDVFSSYLKGKTVKPMPKGVK